MKTLLLAAILGGLALGQEAQKPPEPAKTAEDNKPAAQETKATEEKKTETPAEAATDTQGPFRIEFEVGARWNQGIQGDLNTYRSIVNLGEGPRLMNWDASLEKPSLKWLEKAHFRGYGWGGDPAAWMQFGVEQSKYYRLSIDHRSTAYFSAMPSFANPLIDRGILVNQRSYDTRRRMTDAELTLFPLHRITPYFGFTRDTGVGRGVSNFVSDANEYPVLTNLDDRTNLFRGGVRMEFRSFHLTLEQGGILFRDGQALGTSNRNLGNLTVPYLGQTLFLSNLVQDYSVEGSSVFSKGYVTAQPVSWLDLSGAFQFSQPRNDVTYRQSNQGNFVDIETLLFFNSQNLRILGASNQPHATANFGAELRPYRRFRIIGSIMTDRLHNSSNLVNTPIADRLEWTYNTQQVEAITEVTHRFSLRGGYRYTWGDTLARAPFLVQMTSEHADMKRHSALAGAVYRLTDRISFNADVDITRSDRVLFRTSLSDYERLRMRGRYQVRDNLQLYGTFQYLNNSNPPQLNPYEFRSQQTALGLHWLPRGGKTVQMIAEYARSTIRSDLTFREPQFLSAIDRSFYRENSHNFTGLLTWRMALGWTMQPELSMGGSMFVSNGNRPTNYYQPVVRLRAPLFAHVDLVSEYRWYGVSQPFYLYEGFRSHQGIVGVRVH
ncbi:MAG: hypothetical protein IT167_00020 [Bryobacterales bacterium]|nr:hypothetical protein [Bryobacterales bacterium]